MTKEEKSEFFLIITPFYISFLRRMRAGKIVLQKLRNKSISRRKVQNRVTKYQKESSRKGTEKSRGFVS